MRRLMDMKKIKQRLLPLFFLAIMVFTSACRSKNNTSYTKEMSMDSTPEQAKQKADIGMEDYASSEEAEVVANETKITANTQTNRKLIKRVEMTIETKDFEGLLESISSRVDSLKGYVESSEVSGNSYSVENDSRYASIVIRIPSTELDSFVTSVKEMGNVVNSTESAEDITLQYVDVKSHKNALEVEQERLIAILKDAKKLEDIIKIEERLSDVRYEIESYESKLRTFDNLVDYSIITLNIDEVKHITPVEDETVLQRIKSGLGTTFFHIKTGAQNFVVWFVVNLPYLIFFGIIIGVILLITKRRVKKNGNNDAKPNNKILDDNTEEEIQKK